MKNRGLTALFIKKTAALFFKIKYITKSNRKEAGSPITVRIRPLLSSIHLMNRFFNGDVSEPIFFDGFLTIVTCNV